MSFDLHLGGLADFDQFFLWRLTWSAEEGKYHKMPADLRGVAFDEETGGANNPANWHSYDDAMAALSTLPRNGELCYALGFWLSKGCGYWFLDIDKGVRPDGVLEPVAQELVDAYTGCFMEYSSSGRGVHIIGMGDAPAHRSKPPREIKEGLKPVDLEFYTADRGIAFGLSLVAQGNADVRAHVDGLVQRYFPPRAVSESKSVRPEWRGPADDEVLIEKMLNARQSAEVVFGNAIGLRRLWAGDCAKDSDTDAALAGYLAFWTGCDEPRIERLMMRSGLKRDKWFEKRPGGNYLTYTIANICAGTENVYQEPQRATQQVVQAIYTDNSGVDDSLSLVTTQHVQSDVVSPELFQRVEALIDRVTSCETELDLHNTIIPEIRAAGVPQAFQEKIVAQVKRRLDFWGNKMAVGKVRALLFPPTMRGALSQLPEWARDFCFVLQGDYFFNCTNATQLSLIGFQAAHGKLMPVNEHGKRENAAERCLHFWNMPIVERTGYRPDQGQFYEWDGVKYANTYSPASIPAVATVWTAEGVAGIEAFQQHMFDMCGRRPEVFAQLLAWFAHNVQFPGKKIRWSPIIKGVHGDGKTLLSAVLRAAMGYRNVSNTGNATLTNNGGFTDWAVNGAVNVIEEIMLTGKQRHQLYNAMKEFISNNVVNINSKGARTTAATFNCTNHIANTNHNDALPMEQTDRRWFVIFTPWEDLAAMYRFCGLADVAAWKRRTDAIDYAWKNCAGELRAWFLALPMPADFSVDGSAPMTPEKMRMMASSQDDAEGVAANIIEVGAIGVSHNVLSSAMLSVALGFKAQADGFEVPKSTALNHMLTRLGFSKFPKIVKWNGRTHTIWLRNGIDLDNEGLRLELDKTLNLTLNPAK